MQTLQNFFWFYAVILGFLVEVVSTHAHLDREKRYTPLIFTNTSAITFICGFGVPVHNLNPELVTVGMVFKSPQLLPTTFQSLWKPSNHSVHKREHSFDKTIGTAFNYRLVFYKALEHFSISLGQAGHSCVLKMICEAAFNPFHFSNGVMGELLHILFTPSSSKDTQTMVNNHFTQAEHHGKSGFNCNELYSDCKQSFLDKVTNLIE